MWWRSGESGYNIVSLSAARLYVLGRVRGWRGANIIDVIFLVHFGTRKIRIYIRPTTRITSIYINIFTRVVSPTTTTYLCNSIYIYIDAAERPFSDLLLLYATILRKNYNIGEFLAQNHSSQRPSGSLSNMICVKGIMWNRE